MLESLLADALTRVLGQYLKGIDRDSVNFGVWSGCLELRGLALRPEALAVLFETLGIELPVTVDAGFIGLLRITVPWKSLGSTPVRIHLDHLTIIARPVRGDASDTSELQLRERRLAKARLATDDAVREAAWGVREDETAGEVAPESKASAGWGARLLTKVIENMQVELSDIVLRFEDQVSDRQRPYVVAIHCDNIKAVSVDESWKEAYIHTTETSSVTRKLIQLTGFEVNWAPMQESYLAFASTNTPSESTTTENAEESPPSKSHETLRDFVLREAPSTSNGGKGSVGEDADETGGSSSVGSKRTSSLIAPFDGSLRASITKRKGAGSRAPVEQDPGAAAELDVRFPEVQMDVDDVQYANLMQTSVYFAKLSSRGFRPSKARDRWIWAVEQILPGFRKRHKEFMCLSEEGLKKRHQERQLYIASRISVLKARRTGLEEPKPIVADLERMEGTLDFADVILYRDIVDRQIAEVSHTWKKKEEPASESNTGTAASVFWSMLGYSSTTAENESKGSTGGASGANLEGASSFARGDADTPASGTPEHEEPAEGTNTGSNAEDPGSEKVGTRRLASASSGTPTASFMGGFLLKKVTLRMKRGGYPSVAEPMVEVSIQDVRVGLTTTPGNGLVVEASLGTFEAWDLRMQRPLVYPLVPRTSSLAAGSSERAAPVPGSVDERFLSSAIGGVPVIHVDDDEFSRAEERGDPEMHDAPSFVGASRFSEAPRHRPTRLQISNSSYPLHISAAMEAIRASAQEPAAAVEPEQVLSADFEDLSNALESISDVHITPGGHTSRAGTVHSRARASDRMDDISEYGTDSDIDSEFLRSAASKIPPSSSLRISQTEFYGSEAGGDAHMGSLDYLVALRIRQEPAHREGSKDVMDELRYAIEIAVGRLEAVVDGPKGCLVWALRFWQPKGVKSDPIMAFVGASAGARIAELRLELEEALFSRKTPTRIDAVICAPRFVVPGRSADSSALVANMGTLRLVSPGKLEAPEVSVASPRGGASEKYSHYMTTLRNVGVYLAPSFASAVSAAFKLSVRGRHDGAKPSESDVSAPQDLFGLEPADHDPSTILEVDRIVRPFSVKLSLLVLQDAHVVQVARQGKAAHPAEDSTKSSVAKVRLRGHVAAVRLVLSQKTCHHLAMHAKYWGRAMAPSRPHAGSDEAESASATSGASSDTAADRTSRTPPTAVRETSGTTDGRLHNSIAALSVALSVSALGLELRDSAGERIISAVASGARIRGTKAGEQDVSGTFRLQSWTVTDGTRGTTAAFRRLAYAGHGTVGRGVSPPHSLAPSSGRTEAASADEEAFVQVNFRLHLPTLEKKVSVRFLSLNLVCVRETYQKVASFVRQAIAEFRDAMYEERKQMVSASAVHAHGRNTTEKELPGGGCETSTHDTASVRARTEMQPPVDTVSEHPRGRIEISAVLDGFNIQLASAEGAIASVDAGDFSMKLAREPLGDTCASGEVGHFTIRDLTCPIEQHSDAVAYQSRSAAEERTRLFAASSDGEVSAEKAEETRDAWEYVSPSSRSRPAVFKTRVSGLKILYLQRFVNILSRYFEKLSADVHHGSMLMKGEDVSPDPEFTPRTFAAPLSNSSSGANAPVVPGSVVEGASTRKILVTVEAHELELTLPRHSACAHESVSTVFGSIRISNDVIPLQGFESGLRMHLADLRSSVRYQCPGQHGELVSKSTRCFQADSAELSIDFSGSGKEGEHTPGPGSDPVSTAPLNQARFLADDSFSATMCEAQYTVIYFVLTENFAEPVAVADTELDKPRDPRQSSVSGQEDAKLSVALETSDGIDVLEDTSHHESTTVRFRLHMHLPVFSLRILRGWEVSEPLYNVILFQLANVDLDVDITEASRILLQLTTSIVEVADIRPEARPGAAKFILPMVEDVGRDESSHKERRSHALFPENLTLSYNKPYQERAKAELVLSNIQVRVNPELLRDLSCLAIPGWPFLESSPYAPDVPYLGRILVVTFAKSQLLFGADHGENGACALLVGGDLIARVNWMRGTAAKVVSLQTRGLNCVLSYEAREQVVRSNDSDRHLGVRISTRDPPVVYPSDASFEYVGPNVDERGRRLDVSIDFMLCRVNLKEAPLLAAIFSRYGQLRPSPLSTRSWTAPNPAAVLAARAAQGNLSAAQSYANRKTLSVELSSPAARLLFTDESNGRFVPILECNLKSVKLAAVMPQSIHYSGELSMSLFNDQKGWWEPGLEAWRLQASFNAGHSGARSIRLESDSALNVNLTPSTYRGALAVARNMRAAIKALQPDNESAAHDRAQRLLSDVTSTNWSSRRRPSVAAFHVTNMLGENVMLWLPHDSRRRPLEDSSTVDIDLPRDTLIPGATGQERQDDNVAREKALRCSVLLPGFAPLELSAAEIGVRSVSLRVEDGEDTMALDRTRATPRSATTNKVVVWEVAMENGVPACTLRSLVQVVNETATDVEVELSMAHGDGSDASDPALVPTAGLEPRITLVRPGARYRVPLALVGQELRVRPRIEDPPCRSEGLSDDDADQGIRSPGSDQRDDSRVAFSDDVPPPLEENDGLHAVEEDASVPWSQRQGTLDVEDDNHLYLWSAPLPPLSLLRSRADAGRKSGPMQRKNSAQVGFMRGFAPSSTTNSSSLVKETLLCSGRETYVPDFHFSVFPRIATAEASHRSSRFQSQWLDIVLEAPLVLKNLLPGLLSYQVTGQAESASPQPLHGIPDSARVLGSGVIRPTEQVHIHTVDSNPSTCMLAFAYHNAAETPTIDREDVPGDGASWVRSEDPPRNFGNPNSLDAIRKAKRGVRAEAPPSSTSTTTSPSSRRDGKGLFVQVTESEAQPGCLEMWSQFWIRNRSEVPLEFCGRPSFYAGGTAVHPLPACPPGSGAAKFLCFEGPYISVRRSERHNPDGKSRRAGSSANLGQVPDWWTHPADLNDTVKPVAVGLPGVSLVLEVRPGLGKFSRTMVVTIRNAAWIVNRTPSTLQWCQTSALDPQGNVPLRHVKTLPPSGAHAIHWDPKTETRSVNLRLADDEREGFSGWVWSPSIPMSIGNKGEFPAKMYHFSTGGQYIARVVSVKLKGGSSSLQIYPEDFDNPPYRISNMCRDRFIAFHQVGSDDRPWVVRPGNCTRYSWDNPLAAPKRRELRVYVMEKDEADRHENLSSRSSGHASSLNDDVTSSPDTPGNAGGSSANRRPRHPKFSLNIDVVNDEPIVRRDTFDPPLLSRVSVHGATKTVTFEDAAVEGEPSETVEQSDDFAKHAQHDSEDIGASVPTVEWDDIGPSQTQGNVVDAKADHSDTNTDHLMYDYPQRHEASVAVSVAASEVASRKSRDVDLEIRIGTAGVSVIDSTPIEVFYLWATGIGVKFVRLGELEEMVFHVSNLQGDNQLPNAAYPVLLWMMSPPSEIENAVGSSVDGRESPGDPEGTRGALTVEAQRLSIANSISMWKGVYAVVQHLNLALDEEFVVRVIALGREIVHQSEVQGDELLSPHDGEQIPLGFDSDSDRTSASERRSRANPAPRLSDVSRPDDVSRVYVEELRLSPWTVFLSSTASRGSTSLRSAGFRSASLRTFVAVLLNVDNCGFDFSALELHHVFDTSQHFTALIKEFYMTQLANQRMKLLASNTLIGNPAALFDSVAVGARDLFVEPSRAKGSAEFLASVGRGSKSLLTNTVGGLVGSIGGIPRAVATGLENAVGDREYLAERERIRRQELSGGLRPLSTTPAQGVVTGAMSFAHGISSGVAGLLRDPVVGARQGGPAGFIRGVGKGLVGGVVKPVTGVMDLIAEPAAGISRSVSSAEARKSSDRIAPIRPPRTFSHSGQRVVEYDLRAATGQALFGLVQFANSLTINDRLMDWVELRERDEQDDVEGVISCWEVVRRHHRWMRGSRRSRGPTRDGEGSQHTERLERLRAALLTETRLLVASYDGALVSNFPLDEHEDMELIDNGKELHFCSAGTASQSGESRERRVLHRVQCGSIPARDDLRRIVEGALMVLRQSVGSTARRPLRSDLEEVTEELAELQQTADPERDEGLQLQYLDSSYAADGTPGVFTRARMPGRDSSGNLAAFNNSLPTTQAQTPAEVPPRAVHDIEAAIRRLVMGGTHRDVTAKRSVRAVIVNELAHGQSLRLIRSSLDDGTWRQPPPSTVRAQTALMIEADSGGRAADAGNLRASRDVRASLVYGVTVSGDSELGVSEGETGRVPQVEIDFVNPILSQPSYSIRCSHGFRGVFDGGRDSHSTVVFRVSEEARRPAQSMLRSDASATGPDSPSLGATAALASLARRSSASPSPPRAPGPSSSGSLASIAGGALRSSSKRFMSAASSLASVSKGQSTASMRSQASSSSRSTSVANTGSVRSQSSAMAGATSGVQYAEALEQLVGIGFDRDLAASALEHTNGDIVQAVDLLTR